MCASPNQRGRRGDVVSVERERGGFFQEIFSPLCSIFPCMFCEKRDAIIRPFKGTARMGRTVAHKRGLFNIISICYLISTSFFFCVHPVDMYRPWCSLGQQLMSATMSVRPSSYANRSAAVFTRPIDSRVTTHTQPVNFHLFLLALFNLTFVQCPLCPIRGCRAGGTITYWNFDGKFGTRQSLHKRANKSCCDWKKGEGRPCKCVLRESRAPLRRSSLTDSRIDPRPGDAQEGGGGRWGGW